MDLFGYRTFGWHGGSGVYNGCWADLMFYNDKMESKISVSL